MRFIKPRDLIIVCSLLMACSPGTSTKNQAGNQKEERRITVQAFQNILDSARVSGAILVYDPREET